MIKKVYNVFDTKAKAFLEPFYTINDDTAMRVMVNCLRDVDHPFCKNPEDYQLFSLGEFDDTTGMFKMLDAPEHMVSLNTINLEG